ncbi:hypothetical protein NC651_003442 [Populus alba x Populus x berolinensis]|nr:hypothetical protein NC651_003442 [Populus alba x Populus x berolinensis]
MFRCFILDYFCVARDIALHVVVNPVHIPYVQFCGGFSSTCMHNIYLLA